LEKKTVLRIGREAARFGVEDLGLDRIQIVIAVENQRSQRVAEKAMAQRERCFAEPIVNCRPDA